MRAGQRRVLQVALSLQPGGTERLIVDLVRRLRADIPMAVCCLDEDGAWGRDLRAEGVPVEALGRRPGFHPLLGWRVAAAARRTGASVLHCHQYSPFVYGALARLSRPGLRLVFTEHGRLADTPPSRRRRRVNPALALAAHRMFAVSHDLRRHMIAEGLPARRIEVIHNGIELSPLPSDNERRAARDELSAAPGQLAIGTVARLDPVKDLGRLIDAAALLAAAGTDAVVAVIGDGPERASLERAARERGVASRVRFLGHREDARRLLAGLDVFVNCSVSEGVSLTILEAMAAGLPVVATAVGGTPEVLNDGCGRLVPARDTAALAAAVRSLAARLERDELGMRARAHVEASFTIERMVERYRDVYLEV